MDDTESFDQRIDPIRLRTFMREYLRLPAESSDEQIRAVLFKRDDGLLAWYDNRQTQGQEFNQSVQFSTAANQHPDG